MKRIFDGEVVKVVGHHTPLRGIFGKGGGAEAEQAEQQAEHSFHHMYPP